MEGKKSPEEQEECWIQSMRRDRIKNCQKSGSCLSFDVFAGSEIKTFKPAQQDGCRLVKEEHGSFMT